jgi:hypothetical protein
MKNLQGILGVLFILAFSGCSALSVDSYYDPSASYTGLKTYGWLPAPEEMIDDPSIDQGLLSSRIQAAVDRELSAIGFTRQSTPNPDFFIGYQATTPQKSQSNRFKAAPSLCHVRRRLYSQRQLQAVGKMDGRLTIDEGQRQFQSTGPTRIFYQLSK